MKTTFLFLALLIVGSLLAQDGVFCPVCIKTHRESRVFPGGGSSTLVYCQAYYDEKGKSHYHECNTSTWTFSCSRNHRWAVISHGSPCPQGDFDPGPVQTVIYEEEPNGKKN